MWISIRDLEIFHWWNHIKKMLQLKQCIWNGRWHILENAVYLKNDFSDDKDSCEKHEWQFS